MSAVSCLSSEHGNALFHPRGPAPSTLGSKLQKQRSTEVTRGRFGGQAWKWWTSVYSHSRSQRAVRWPYLTAAELGRSLAVHSGDEKMGLVNSEAISTTLNLDINCKRSLIGFPVFTFVLSQFFFSTCQPNDPSKGHSDHFPPLLNTFQWLFISCVYSKALIMPQGFICLLLSHLLDSFLSLLHACSLQYSHTGGHSLLQICQAHRISSFPCPEHSSPWILSELTLILPSDLCSNSSLLSSLY